MEEKDFEKAARTLLNYEIGANINESREKLRALIKNTRIINKKEKEARKGAQ